MFNYVCTGTMVTLPTRDSTLCRRKVEDVLLGEDSFPVVLTTFRANASSYMDWACAYEEHMTRAGPC